MKCEQAKKLIDQRVQESAQQASGDATAAAPDTAATHDWSALDEHLAQCRKCSADFLELLRARNLLAGLADDAPTPKETEAMWTAIQSAAASPASRGWPTSSDVGSRIMSFLRKSRPSPRFAAATVGIAAVLTMAFLIGEFRYEVKSSDQAAVHVEVMNDGAAPSADSTSLGTRLRAPVVESRPRSSRRGSVVQETGMQAEAPAPDEETLDRLVGLGYVGADSLGPRVDDTSTTKELWELVRSGEITPKLFISPSSDEEVATPAGASDSFMSFDSVSFGYEVPYGPGQAPTAEAPMPIRAKSLLRAPPKAPSLPEPGASQGEADRPVHARAQQPFETQVFLGPLKAGPAQVT
ncbi:MAG: anti-sigma factor, partial [Planctomycetota bacterium]